MTDEQRFSSGELHRLITRVDQNVEAMRREAKEDRHKTAGDLQAIVGDHIELRARVTHNERTINDLKDDVESMDEKISSVVKNAAFASGGISLGAFLLSVIGWPWGKH